MTEPIFTDKPDDLAYRAKFWTSRAFIYGILIIWAIICIFPMIWTITTSFKQAPDVMQGHIVPFFDDQRRGWVGDRWLSPDTINASSTVRDEFVRRFFNSTIISVSASLLAVFLFR